VLRRNTNFSGQFIAKENAQQIGGIHIKKGTVLRFPS